MKKTIFLTLLLFIPVSAYAELEFFLSPSGSVYSPDSWTSDVYPDTQSGFIGIDFFPSVDPVPKEYVVVDTLVREFFTTIVSQTGSTLYETQETLQYETDLYETLISTENPQFIEYITTAINPYTQTTIEEKLEQNIVLTPFEETFYNCNISLEERQEIVLDVLQRIASWDIENLENISYSNPQFGDCIIPFPDISHRETVIENSFSSNQLLAQTILWEQTRYEVHESIENIMTQENEFRESIIENEIFFSHLLQENTISQDQYLISQDIESYYQNILSTTEITSELHKILSQEYIFLNENMIYYWKLLEQNIISQEEYNLYLEDIKKIRELQKYYLDLLLGWKISIEEYKQRITQGETYLQSQKTLIEKYTRSEFTKDEYTSMSIAKRDIFKEDYIELSQYFSESYSYETQREIPEKNIFILVAISVVLGCIFVFLFRNKIPVWKK